MPGEERESEATDDFEKSQRIFPIFSILFSVVLVWGHAFFPGIVTLNWEMVALLGAIAFLPYIPELEWVQVGNMGGIGLQNDVDAVEAEVRPLFEDIKESIEAEGEKEEESETESESEEEGEEEVEGGVSTTDTPETVGRMKGIPQFAEDIPAEPSPQLREFEKQLYKDLNYDPRYGLTKLRAGLEVAEKQYLESIGIDIDHRQIPHQEFRTHLENSSRASSKIMHALQEVRMVCNEAIHGEEIHHDTAVDILQMGIGILRYLEYMADLDHLDLSHL